MNANIDPKTARVVDTDKIQAGDVQQIYAGNDVCLSQIQTDAGSPWVYVHGLEPGLLGGMIVLKGDELALRVTEYSSVGGQVLELCRMPEEAGCSFTKVEKLYEGPSSSGFTSDCYSLTKAEQVEQVSEASPSVEFVRLSEIQNYITSKAEQGILIDPHIYSALYFIERDHPDLELPKERIQELSEAATPSVEQVVVRNTTAEEVAAGKSKYLEVRKSGDQDYGTRTKGVGSVIAPTLTNKGELLFIEQNRWPVVAGCGDQGTCIEWPAGLIADNEQGAEETAKQATRKELWEEAACDVDSAQIVEVACGPIVPKIGNELLSFNLVIGAQERDPYDPPVGLEGFVGGAGVDNEQLTVRKVKFEEIDNWLIEQKAAGKHIDPKIYIGLYFLREIVTPSQKTTK